MRANGHTIVWGTHISFGKAKDRRGVFAHLVSWLTSKIEKPRRASVVCNGTWNARREELSHLRADAALDIAAARGSFPTAMLLYSAIF